MHFLFQISSTLCKRASSTAFWPGFHEAEAIFSEQIVTPFFPYGLTYPLESAFLQGHITVRQRPIVMFRITDQSILSKKKAFASVAKTLQAVFFPKFGGRPNQKKKILILKLYHCIYELYKLQRIFLSRRSIMCTSYLKKDIVFRMRGSNTYSMAKFLCAFEDISKCQIIRILRQKFWQQ